VCLERKGGILDRAGPCAASWCGVDADAGAGAGAGAGSGAVSDVRVGPFAGPLPVGC
jgi:hypothetical protein